MNRIALYYEYFNIAVSVFNYNVKKNREFPLPIFDKSKIPNQNASAVVFTPPQKGQFIDLTDLLRYTCRYHR